MIEDESDFEGTSNKTDLKSNMGDEESHIKEPNMDKTL